LYDVTARGFRPHWKDWRLAVIFSTVYTAIMFPLDAAFHLDYGYLGPTLTGQTSPFDHLGPWPWRVASMYGLAMLVMLLLFVPRAAWRIHSSKNEGPITADKSDRSRMPAVADS